MCRGEVVTKPSCSSVQGRCRRIVYDTGPHHRNSIGAELVAESINTQMPELFQKFEAH